MKKLLLLLFVVSILGFPVVTLAFEGIIVQKNTHVASGVNPGMEAMEKMLGQMPPDQRRMMEERMKEAMGGRSAEPDVTIHTIYIKGPRMRMDLDQEEGEKTFMVMDLQDRVVRNFFPERRAYLEMTFDEVEQMGEGLSEMQKEMGAGKRGEKVGELTKTGGKKRINGYMCELYTQQVGDQTNEYWITKEVTMKQIMGEFGDRMKSLGKAGGQEALQEAFVKMDGYPILTVTRNRYGTNHNEVMKIEKKGLNDDMFATPSGYKKQSMQDMMNRKP